MLDTLPNELLDNVYSWLSLTSIGKSTRQLSKRHRVLSIRRLIAAIDGLRVSLDIDLDSDHRDYEWNHRSVVLNKDSTLITDMIRFQTDAKFNRAEPLFVAGELAATDIKIVIYEDPDEGGMHAKLFEEPFPEIVGVRLVGGVPLVFPPFPEKKRGSRGWVAFETSKKKADRKYQFVRHGFKNSTVVRIVAQSVDPKKTDEEEVGGEEVKGVDVKGKEAKGVEAKSKGKDKKGKAMGSSSEHADRDDAFELNFEWDLFMDAKYGEATMEVSLTAVEIPVAAFLEVFWKHQPGKWDYDDDDELAEFNAYCHMTALSSILSHIAAFSIGCGFTLLALGIAVVLLLRSSTLMQGSSPAHTRIAKKTPKQFSQADRKPTLHKSFELGNDGEYDPQLEKVGWMRLSDESLTTDQLYMDSRGSDTIYFLGGLGSVISGDQRSPAETFAAVKPIATKSRNYVNSINFIGQTLFWVAEASLQTSSYLVSRFIGETVELPQIAEPPSEVRENFVAP
ncbi:hypothetical protein HDU98_006019 [Podochytrium sp. JEL0797]|nr:hypothetical protein HDU98_006019 [Podochytrium sp. JEL0797]